MDKKSSSITVSARSVDEAVDQALQRLGLSREQVEIEVIKRGSRGLLGLLSEDAVVRVTAKAPSPPPVVETAVPAAAVQKAETVPEPPPAADHDEIARIGTEVLQNLLDHMALHARIAREKSPDLVRLNVMGKDLGVLIGRRGETLRDLQYLTCLLVSRRRQRWPNLIVDVEHYKSRREKLLTDLARRMADRVRSTGEPMPLEPMPAYERRIVHLALRDDPDVFTESSGQDEKRRVVILPKS